ncbi:hypothetical protein [Synechococcus sp. BS55D]|uniref:hypothetical protein n=1 Tax=Synechococcus sp. BS55D TaxID=2055943 RepID=UPI0013755961
MGQSRLGTGDLLQGNFEDARATLGLEGPAADPAAVVVSVDADDLEEIVGVVDPNAVTLVKIHGGVRRVRDAALPRGVDQFVRHEPDEAQIGKCRPVL